jgi:hypothetical protein
MGTPRDITFITGGTQSVFLVKIGKKQGRKVEIKESKKVESKLFD